MATLLTKKNLKRSNNKLTINIDSKSKLYDFAVFPLLSVLTISSLLLVKNEIPVKLVDLVPVQVGVIDGNQLNSLFDSASPSGTEYQEADLSKGSGSESPNGSVEGKMPVAQKGNQQGTSGFTYGIPRVIPIKPEVKDLPYGPNEVPVVVLIDWRGIIYAVDLLDTTGDLSRDLIIKNATKLMKISEFEEFKKIPLKEGQKTWISFSVLKDNTWEPYLP